LKTLSKKCKYALRALYALTREYGNGPVLMSKLSHAEKLPHKFLEVILWELKQKGFVISKTGKRGGYQLAKPPSSITIGSIIRTIDGPLAPLPCASETAYRRCEECVDESRCGTRIMMRQVRDAMAAILDGTSLADICKQVEKEEALPEELMYHI
jgi:Rrf2 family protein